MKKMKRFLSLLICMVMLMSVLPMSASADWVFGVELSMPTKTDKTAQQIMAGIEVTNGYAEISSREITKTEKTEEKDTVFVKLILNETGWNWFWENVSVSIKNNDAVLVGKPERTSTGYGMDTDYRLTVNLKFEMSHVHSVDLVRGTPKTCTTAGQKDYYECACGAVFEDADHSKPISELDTWKVIPAGHEYGEIRKQEEKHETDKLQAAVAEHYYCELCKKYFNPDKTETTLEALTGETPRHQYGPMVNTDHTGHYKECTYESCEARDEVGPHNYDDNEDFDCNTCGYYRGVKVTFVNEKGQAPAEKTIIKGTKVNNPGKRSADGYIFNGWYNGETKFDFDNQINEDIILTANWTPITYRVVFYPSYYTYDFMEPQEFTYDQEANLKPNEYTLTGFEFLGWATKWDGPVVYADGALVKNLRATNNATVDLFAKWAEQYKITYNLDGGNLVGDETNPTTYTKMSDDIVLNKPERAGYEFLGWTGSNGDTPQKEVTIDTSIGGHKSYTANWKIKQYTITFDSKGGSTVKPITQDYNTAVTAPEDPTKTGYTFAGWTPALPEVMPLNGMTVEAQWTPVVESIKVSPNPWTMYTGDEKEFTAEVVAGDGIDTSKIEWFVEPDPAEEPIALLSDEETTIDKNSGVLKAGKPGNYIVKAIVAGHNTVGTAKVEVLPVHTVTFDANGKGTDPDPQPVKHGLTATAPDAPEADGYSFAGWYLDKECTKVYDFKNPVVDDTTLYAKWLEVYTITYKLDNGTVATANPTTYTVETADIKLNNPTKAGYTFAGWTGTGLDKATMEVTIAKGSTGNREYTATWTQNVVPVTYFKVTYDANKGTGEMPEVSVEAGKDHTLLANEFKAPAGKTFKCWKIGTKEYKAGEKIEVTENVTVKAVWKNKTASSDLDYVPAAGDNFPTFLWAGLLLFSVVALVEVVVLRRKRS